MTATTLKALRDSIAHHKRNLRAKTPDDVKLGIKDCALCEVFLNATGNHRLWCIGCPVMEKTGEPLCSHTPYRTVYDRGFEWREDVTSRNAKSAFLTAERAEIKFLESLLPKTKKTKGHTNAKRQMGV